jgi:citrate lyase alpha subunit
MFENATKDREIESLRQNQNQQSARIKQLEEQLKQKDEQEIFHKETQPNMYKRLEALERKMGIKDGLTISD